jgi:hypothetical protein
MALLDNCIRGIKEGPWTLLQLRGDLISSKDVNGDDVDFLTSPESLDLLLKSVFEWTKNGWCHGHVRRRLNRKAELCLFSPEGSACLKLDLWLRLPQLDEGRTLTLENCVGLLSGTGIQRLPLKLEVALYLQHLLAKKKDLREDKYRKSLANYRQRCPEFALELESVEELGIIPGEVKEHSAEILREAFGESPTGKTPLLGIYEEGFLSYPRTVKAISVMGCDGAGKTSLSWSLTELEKRYARVFTGKHLYRKSWLYKLAVIFIRPFTFQSRERFDELFAPLVYLRACLGLRIKLLRWKRGITLIDRGLLDFMYLNRKSDRPGFSRLFFLSRLCGKRIPVVHVMADYAAIRQRKDEVSEKGHECYDKDMWQAHALRCPTDYLAFNNTGSLKNSSLALDQVLRKLS